MPMKPSSAQEVFQQLGLSNRVLQFAYLPRPDLRGCQRTVSCRWLATLRAVGHLQDTVLWLTLLLCSFLLSFVVRLRLRATFGIDIGGRSSIFACGNLHFVTLAHQFLQVIVDAVVVDDFTHT